MTPTTLPRKRKIFRMGIISCFSLFSLFCGSAVNAQEAMSIGRSYRSLAMGNTGVASAIDGAALFYNPAILAHIRGMFIDYAAFTLEASQGFTATDSIPLMISNAFPFVNRDGISDGLSVAFLSKTNPYIRTSAGINFATNLDKKGFSVAASYFSENIATVPAGTTTLYQRGDTILKGGLSYPIGLGQLVVGIAASQITRRVSEVNIPATPVTQWSAKYQGTSYDIGILYRMANRARITWGLAAMNVGGVTFSGASFTEPQQLAFGVSMNQELGTFKVTPAIDIRQIGATTGKTNTIHVGVEIGMLPNDTGGSAFTYRMGLNQSYLSYGIEMNMLNHSFIVGVTDYGEEIGVGTATLENRRRIIYFSLGF